MAATSPLFVRAWPLELINGEALAGDLVAEEIAALREHVAPDLFKGFDPAVFPKSSLPAMTLAAAAYRRSPHLGERLSLSLRDALFEQGRDIGAADVLAELAREHQVEPPDAVDRPAIVADWNEGRRRGAKGSPHFFVSEGYFCPALEIKRVDGRLQVTADRSGFDEFIERALSTRGSDRAVLSATPPISGATSARSESMIGWALLADWDDGRMMGHGGGNGWWWVMFLGMLVIAVAVVIVVWLATRSATPTGVAAPGDPNTGARKILGERLARGEIDPAEYQDRLSHLT